MNYTNSLIKWYAEAVPFDPAAIAADAVTLAELHGGTGHESVRIDWLPGRKPHLPCHPPRHSAGRVSTRLRGTASVFPAIGSVNPVVTAMITAERAACLIRQDR